jgi:hypothetical protein
MIIETCSNEPLIDLTIIIYLLVGQFITQSILTLSGVYKYYSPMLLGYMHNNAQIDLHMGYFRLSFRDEKTQNGI